MGVDSSLQGVPEFDKLQVVKTGSGSITNTVGSGGGTTVATITHNLGYVPIVMAYGGSLSTGMIPLPLPTAYTTDNTLISFWEYMYVSNITSTTFDISLAKKGPSGTTTKTFSYILLRYSAGQN